MKRIALISVTAVLWLGIARDAMAAWPGNMDDNPNGAGTEADPKNLDNESNSVSWIQWGQSYNGGLMWSRFSTNNVKAYGGNLYSLGNGYNADPNDGYHKAVMLVEGGSVFMNGGPQRLGQDNCDTRLSISGSGKYFAGPDGPLTDWYGASRKVEMGTSANGIMTLEITDDGQFWCNKLTVGKGNGASVYINMSGNAYLRAVRYGFLLGSVVGSYAKIQLSDNATFSHHGGGGIGDNHVIGCSGNPGVASPGGTGVFHIVGSDVNGEVINNSTAVGSPRDYIWWSYGMTAGANGFFKFTADGLGNSDRTLDGTVHHEGEKLYLVNANIEMDFTDESTRQSVALLATNDPGRIYTLFHAFDNNPANLSVTGTFSQPDWEFINDGTNITARYTVLEAAGTVVTIK